MIPHVPSHPHCGADPTQAVQKIPWSFQNGQVDPRQLAALTREIAQAVKPKAIIAYGDLARTDQKLELAYCTRAKLGIWIVHDGRFDHSAVARATAKWYVDVVQTSLPNLPQHLSALSGSFAEARRCGRLLFTATDGDEADTLEAWTQNLTRDVDAGHKKAWRASERNTLIAKATYLNYTAHERARSPNRATREPGKVFGDAHRTVRVAMTALLVDRGQEADPEDGVYKLMRRMDQTDEQPLTVVRAALEGEYLSDDATSDRWLKAAEAMVNRALDMPRS